jgi:formate dehydrogenase maturation protein FdhE
VTLTRQKQSAHRATGERFIRTQTNQTKPADPSATTRQFNRVRFTCACAECTIEWSEGRFVCSACGATLATPADAVNRVMLDICEAEYLRESECDQ